MFTFFPPFWPKEVKTKPLLCLPLPSFLPPPLLSLISLTTENPTRETEGFCCSQLHFRHSPGVTLHALSPEPSISREQGHRFRQVMSDGSYYPHWHRRNQGAERGGHPRLSDAQVHSLVHPSSHILQMCISTKENKMNTKVAKGRNPAPSVP